MNDDRPMIDLFPSGLVLRGGIHNDPMLRSWIDVYLDYLVSIGIDPEATQISVYMPDEIWYKLNVTKKENGWECNPTPSSLPGTTKFLSNT